MSEIFEVIVTLGPSILNKNTIVNISKMGPCIFRINGAHTGPDDIKKIIRLKNGISPGIKLLIDLPGNKIRTSDNFRSRYFKKGDEVSLMPADLNFGEFHGYLKEGEVIFTNDSLNSMIVRNVEKDTGMIVLEAENDGCLVNNKGIHARNSSIPLPFLFKKDREIIDIINKGGIDYCALSFVRDVGDVKEVKGILTNHDVTLIAKIEKIEAVNNLDSILGEVDNILVDRGDLSNDVGMLKLPFYEDMIVKKSLEKSKKVFLATQFLKYMEHNPIPLIAEVMGLFNDISEGAAGIQLSEETAVGEYPEECVKLVFEMHKEIKSKN